LYFIMTRILERCDTDHSPPSSAEVKNECGHTSAPQYAFMGCCSVEAHGQLYFLHFPKQQASRGTEQVLSSPAIAWCKGQ